jgi:DNA-binding FadR family transcriptional regulator
VADQFVSGTVERPVRNRPALAVAVIETLTRDIVTEKYPPGTALPASSALCEMFSVSRTVIREALTSLAEKGLVAARQGWGTIVLDQSHWSLLDPMILDGLFQREDRLRYLDNLIEIRTTLEGAMAASATKQMTEEGRAALDAKLDLLATLLEQPEQYELEDLAFHRIIHAVSGDAFGSAIVASIQGKARRTPQYQGTPTRHTLDLTQAEHKRVRDAVVAGDADAAAREMRDHITASWARRRPRDG